MVKAPKTRQEFAEVITTAWNRALRNVIRAGKWLLKAEVKLKPSGDFHRMIEDDLPFGERVAQRLMAIARHEVLRDPTHESGLPRSYITLYELSKLPPPEVKELLEYKIINIDTSRQQAEQLAKRFQEEGDYWFREVQNAFTLLVRFRERKVAKKLPEMAAMVYRMTTHRGPLRMNLDTLAEWIKEIDTFIEDKRRSEQGRDELNALVRTEEHRRQQLLAAKRSKPLSAKEQRRRLQARNRMYERHYGKEEKPTSGRRRNGGPGFHYAPPAGD